MSKTHHHSSHKTKRERRTTFKKHSRNYAKIYAPYLPAILIFVLAASLFFGYTRPNNQSDVLNYATNINSGDLLDRTNSQRQNAKSAELKLNSKLAAAAQTKAEDMVKRNYWSHLTPDGKQPWSFIDQTGYKYNFASENLAFGFGTSADTVQGWMNSPDHAQALLDSNANEVGFGIANSPDFLNKGPQTVIVALYGRPASSATLSTKQSYAPIASQQISYGQTLTSGQMPWINFAAGLLAGIAVMYLITHHTFNLRRKLKQGGKFFVHHPSLDLAWVSVFIFCLVISQTAGFIQ